MKKFRITFGAIFMIVMGAFFLTSCQKSTLPLTACISPISDTVYVGDSVHFASCNVGAQSYGWNFGDGSSATTASVSHVFSSAGAYVVTLTVSDAQSARKSVNITVLPSGGSWTYNSGIYQADQSYASSATRTMTSSVNLNQEVDDVICRFSTFPPAPGTYTITNTLPYTSNEVYVIMNLGTKTYTVNNTSSATATVHVSSGRIIIDIPNATFINTASPTDVGTFSANLRQSN